jgi:hypothetical protein
MFDSSTQNDTNAFFKKHLSKLYSRYLKKQRAKAYENEVDQLKAKLVHLVSSPEYQRLLELNDRKYSDDDYPLSFMVEYRRYPHNLLEENLSSKHLLSAILNGDGEGDTIVFWDFTSDEFDLASQALSLENEDRMLKDLREGLEMHWVSSMNDASLVPAVKDLMSVHKPAILICDRYASLVREAQRIARKYN